ncbi:MAG: phosphopantetheine-binding protein [Elainella sp.]
MTQTQTPSSFTAETIQTWFVAQVAEQNPDLDPEDIDVNDRFDSFGLDSARAMLIASRAEKMLGFQLSPSWLWHYPTIAGLSQRLAEEAQQMEAELLSELDPETIAQALKEVESR